MLLFYGLLSTTRIPLFCALHQSDPICDAITYGRPTMSDCHTAYRAISKYSDPHMVYSCRVFVEPQLRIPPFAGVTDAFLTGIVQLPKIWTSGKPAWYYRQKDMVRWRSLEPYRRLPSRSGDLWVSVCCVCHSQCTDLVHGQKVSPKDACDMYHHGWSRRICGSCR